MGEGFMASTFDRSDSAGRDIALLVARILFSALFLVAAYNKATAYGGALGYFAKLGIPMPAIALPLVIAFEAIAGLLLIVGYKTRIVALLLGLFCVVAAASAHGNLGDSNQLNHFLKNIALAGGALAFYAAGAGSYSVDGRR
jgi:putative oxidoreductase